MAHSPTTYAESPQLVYVVCGRDGCGQRLVLHVADWEEEQESRQLAANQATSEAHPHA
jgi:hypothetical protein